MHVHNTWPLVSPAVYWAAAKAGVPVVQTLHNFRLLCPQGLMLREGRICEDCVGHVPWRAARHRCYREFSGAERGGRRHDPGSSRARHMEEEGCALHRAQRILPGEIHRGRVAGRAHPGKTEFRGCALSLPKKRVAASYLLAGWRRKKESPHSPMPGDQRRRPCSSRSLGPGPRTGQAARAAQNFNAGYPRLARRLLEDGEGDCPGIAEYLV